MLGYLHYKTISDISDILDVYYNQRQQEADAVDAEKENEKIIQQQSLEDEKVLLIQKYF